VKKDGGKNNMNIARQDIRARLREGNKNYITASNHTLRLQTAEEGQHPYAIVVCCSDSRVIPERIFSVDIGELFVIRVAGIVLDKHQLGSIEYAASHLGSQQIVVLGHTGCGAVHAALNGGGDGFIKYITDDILEAVGEERDPDKACSLNVAHAVDKLEKEFAQHPEMQGIDVAGAVYDIRSGEVRWL
jgi:carbonic anhydrase